MSLAPHTDLQRTNLKAQLTYSLHELGFIELSLYTGLFGRERYLHIMHSCNRTDGTLHISSAMVAVHPFHAVTVNSLRLFSIMGMNGFLMTLSGTLMSTGYILMTFSLWMMPGIVRFMTMAMGFMTFMTMAMGFVTQVLTSKSVGKQQEKHHRTESTEKLGGGATATVCGSYGRGKEKPLGRQKGIDA